MSRLKVYGHPYGDGSSASARIRFHRVLEAMEDIEMVSDPAQADVIYIQKRADGATIPLAANHKHVVYDIDDAPGQCASADLEARIMSAATLITTDTSAKVALHAQAYASKLRLVPDCIDYFDAPPAYEVRMNVRNVLTFGWDHSVVAAMPFLLTLRNTYLSLNFKYVTSKQLIESERIEFVQWNAENVKREMMEADIAIICHPLDRNGSLRPATRLYTCMAAGLPALALNSGNHAEALDLIGEPTLLFRDNEIVDKFRALLVPSRREALSSKFKEFAWSNFSPTVVARRLRSVFEEAANA